MTTTARANEIMATMKSFSKETYYKEEVLPELLQLQREIVEVVFDEDHAANGHLKIWDVEKYLQHRNEEYGHVANKELQKFQEGSKSLCNLIKAEISGNRGECKAFRMLEYLQSQNKVLKNIELRDGDVRTEIDALVVTSKCLTIIEVKNTAKNIFIDEKGDYYRTGEFLRWDCNIAEKMAVKEDLLRKVIAKAGFGHVQIRSIVVFTNNRIEVQNRFNRIRTCFVSQLAYIIDGFRLDNSISTEEMEEIQKTIEAVACKEAYPIDFDAEQYKGDFTNLLVLLEDASKKIEGDKKGSTAEKEETPLRQGTVSFTDVFKQVFSSKWVGGTATVSVLMAVASVIAVNTITKGRLYK